MMPPVMLILRRQFLALLAAGLICGCGGSSESAAADLVVFAAASLRDVAGDLAADFERRQPVEVSFNFAGSNTLAQQIDAAPRADVFLSADEHWVDFLDANGRTVPGSRRNVLGNRLVAVAHLDATVEIREVADLASAEYRFLALADPQAVPAGRYAQAALEGMNLESGDLWSAVASRVAPALDVRAALALVESDPEIVGIVYRTDALTSPKVRVLFELPAADGAAIAYCATLVAGGSNVEMGRRFLDYLASAEAAAIAQAHGFGTLGQ